MNPLAVAIHRSDLTYDPKSYRRAFIDEYFDGGYSAAPDSVPTTMIRVVAARRSFVSLCGFLLILVGGSAGASIGLLPGLALLGMNLSVILIATGSLIVRARPDLYSRGATLFEGNIKDFVGYIRTPPESFHALAVSATITIYIAERLTLIALVVLEHALMATMERSLSIFSASALLAGIVIAVVRRLHYGGGEFHLRPQIREELLRRYDDRDLRAG